MLLTYISSYFAVDQSFLIIFRDLNLLIPQPDPLYWLAAIRLPTIGPVSLRHWINLSGDLSKLFTASEVELIHAGFKPKQIESIKAPDWRTAEQDLLWCEKNHCYLISILDPQYPSLLKEIYGAPILLFVQGDIELLQKPQLAIVGSRNPTPIGKALAEQFAQQLTSAGLVITSGLALGIDAAAHRGALSISSSDIMSAKSSGAFSVNSSDIMSTKSNDALSASSNNALSANTSNPLSIKSPSGKTIAILGAGLKKCYPASHHKLADTIRSNGALVSEFPPDEPPNARNFPRRNRIISGLSLGVLVVEAAVNSGSLITARYAAEQGREVFAIPSSIRNRLAHGCHQLIRQGAKLVETSHDIIEELAALQDMISPIKERVSREQPLPIDKKMRAFLTQMSYEVTSFDTIMLRSGLTAGEVSSMLLALELQDYIQTVHGGYQLK